jgi:hypothetical protein
MSAGGKSEQDKFSSTEVCDIKIRGISKSFRAELRRIAKKQMGVTLSTFLKIKLREFVNSYPVVEKH